jgi:hypothetical protein
MVIMTELLCCPSASLKGIQGIWEARPGSYAQLAPAVLLVQCTSLMLSCPNKPVDLVSTHMIRILWMRMIKRGRRQPERQLGRKQRKEWRNGATRKMEGHGLRHRLMVTTGFKGLCVFDGMECIPLVHQAG